MSNALKTIVPGTDPLATDAGQYTMALGGAGDFGTLQLSLPQMTPTAPSVVTSGSAGNLNGTYLWKVALITGWKQSDGSFYVSGFAPSADSASSTVTNNSASLTSIAKGTGTQTIGRAIYRTAAGGAAGTEKFVGVIWDNVTTSFTDNVADANLGTGMPTSASTPAVYGTAIPAAVPSGNTTGTQLLDTNSMLNRYVTATDSNGKPTVVQWKRRDTTLYMQSTISNPDASGNYQTLVENYYDSSGTNVLYVATWSLTYDSYGNIVQMVVS